MWLHAVETEERSGIFSHSSTGSEEQDTRFACFIYKIVIVTLLGFSAEELRLEQLELTDLGPHRDSELTVTPSRKGFATDTRLFVGVSENRP